MTTGDRPSGQEPDGDTRTPRSSQLLHHLETAADGPHDPEATIAVAWLTAETIRYLNHATSSDEGVRFASTLYSVAGALSLAAGRIPQLARQMHAWLKASSGRLANDDQAPISETLTAAGIASQAAADAAVLLALRLGELQNTLALTSNRTPAAEEDND
jgi:hypothetical protein